MYYTESSVLGRLKNFSLREQSCWIFFHLTLRKFLRFTFASSEDTEESDARKEIFDAGGATMSLLNLDLEGTDDTDTTYAPTSFKNFNLGCTGASLTSRFKFSEVTINIKSAADSFPAGIVDNHWILSREIMDNILLFEKIHVFFSLYFILHRSRFAQF